MTLRRRAPMKPSRGTVWPFDVVAHVVTHQRDCIGPLAGMEGECFGQVVGDHVRASGGMGMKSRSVAVNCARLCFPHHEKKTHEGRDWRPKLLAVIADLHGDCVQCQRESIEEYGRPLGEGTHA